MAGHSLQPQLELVEAEWLGDIIIGAILQGLHCELRVPIYDKSGAVSFTYNDLDGLMVRFRTVP